MKRLKDLFSRGKVESYPSGKKSFLDNFKKKTYIKDLDNKILYEGYGEFQDVLEQAVEEGVELPRADLRNKVFKSLQIPNAKITGASFDESSIETDFSRDKGSSDLSKSDLKGVSFRNTKIGDLTFFHESDVKDADFKGCKIISEPEFTFCEDIPIADFCDRQEIFDEVKNLDKAHNVIPKYLKRWTKVQPKIEAERKLLEPSKSLNHSSKTVEVSTDKPVKPTINILKLKARKGR